jgi:hypothetical protein
MLSLARAAVTASSDESRLVTYLFWPAWRYTEQHQCDEGKPKCKKCVLYGVSCDFDGSKPSLDLSAEGAFQIELARGEVTLDFSVAPVRPPVSLNKMDAAIVNHSLFDTTRNPADSLNMADLPHLHRYSTWAFTEKDMETISRFQARTVSTIGSRQAASTYRNCITHLAFSVSTVPWLVISIGND